ncbi:hypothetical protein NQ318_004555 [Aromia moschata]|uniref:Uncharacterized protein n=1 Tax=Aromia moschata TaxID=1265417 RepID=A0AAV8Y8M2_9CUCU|nr:hypothetical protein NQ318_004555 [Aromia moschata]
MATNLLVAIPTATLEALLGLPLLHLVVEGENRADLFRLQNNLSNITGYIDLTTENHTNNLECPSMYNHKSLRKQIVCIRLPKLYNIQLSIRSTKSDDCNLSDDLIAEIQSYQSVVNQIINATINGQFKGETYNELAIFVDKFGNRFSGSQSLEDSIDYLLELMTEYGLDNVHGEDVQVPNWVRVSESANLTSPREDKITLLTLGGSVSTPEGGIEAPVVVVRSMDDLNQNYSNSVDGKIVVFNYEYVNYGSARNYRSQGPIEAARHGAVAALMRSATDFSMNLPHTGGDFVQRRSDQDPRSRYYG